MRNYIIKRILISILILFLVAFIIYALMRSLPTSYIETVARNKSMQPGSKSFEEWMAQLTAMYNMDKGIVPGFIAWLKDVFSLKFGDSWFYTIPVIDKFKQVIPVSFYMGLFTLIFEIVVAIPLGIIAAIKQYSKTDYAIAIFALAGISLPTFFSASLFKLAFSVRLGWFDLYGLVGRTYQQLSPWGQFWDKANHLVLPLAVLCLLSVGSLMRYTRTSMLEVLNSDFIRTARAKGLSEKKVIYHHAFRNTLIPIVTIMGTSLPTLFSGALITETLFAIPGIGLASYNCMVSGDIPFSMFYLVFIAFLTLASTLISDILYAIVDPRVRYS